MTRFKHDLILRIIKIMDAVLMTVPFALCWYLYYAKHIASPFYAKGDYLVVVLFFVLFIIFGGVYDAFLMSMQRISEIVYAQFLAAAVSDFIMYIVIWLLSKHLPNILPGVAALIGQVVLASIWAYNAHHAYFKIFPPQATAVIYDTRQGTEKLIGKYGLDAKYKVVLTATADECIANLAMLDGVSTVFMSGIHSHDRNVILKYCVENNIGTFVIPRIGDTIMSGAYPMHMFHLPMLKVGRYHVSRVGLYGLTYKENVDDMRESPTLQLLESQERHLATGLKVYDPFITKDVVKNQYHDLDTFLADVDMVVVMVKHTEIRENVDKLAGKVVLDCHNVIDLPGVYHI